MKRIIFLLALFLTLGSLERVLACSCISDRPICEAYGRADAIFVGKVIGGKEQRKGKGENGKEGIFAAGETYFQVSEALYGVNNNNQVTLFAEPTTCDYLFQIGETYLVYAYGDEKELGTSICSRTRPLSEAGEDLPALRDLVKENSGTKISGYVAALGLINSEPVAKHKVKLQGGDSTFKTIETLTNDKGEFLFSNIPAGKYWISPALPDLMTFGKYYDSDFEVEVYGKGCESKNFTILNDGIFSGKLVNAKGQPVSNAEVEFIPTNNNFDTENYAKNLSAWTDTTDENGNFSFEWVAVGNYFLAVNVKNPPHDHAHFPMTFYPNVSDRSQAPIFTVKLGQKSDGIVFTVPPPLNEIEVRGVIKREDGKSPIGIQVYLIDVGRNQNFITDSKMIYDAGGNFTFKGYEGRTYVFEAGESTSDDRQIVSSKFVLMQNMPTFTLVMKKVANKK